MKRHFVSLMVALAVVYFTAVVEHASAQSAQSPDAPGSAVVLTKLSEPVYPALAHLARIQGDVEVRVSVRQDGSVESAVIASGHPMLAPAASASALKSQFECRGCSEAVTPYALVYTFQFAAAQATEVPHQSQPIQVIQSQNHVTVLAEPLPIVHVYPTPLLFRVRSVKCLYLWRCGYR
jgi:TonB family protein